MENDHASSSTAKAFTKRAVIYARVSTDEQAEYGYSLKTQPESCRAYAQQQGFKVVGELADDCSGAIPFQERPEGRELYRLVEAKAVDVVILHTFDRTARDEKVIEYLLFKAYLHDNGVELHYADTGLDPYTMEANLVGYIKAHGATEERKKITERTRRGKLAKAKVGKWVGNGDPPYGFRRVDGRANGRLVVDESEMAIVRRIFTLYVGADDQKPLPGKAIARMLTEERVPPPVRHKGTQSKGWYYNSVLRLLGNRAYLGEFRYGGQVIRLPELAMIDPVLFEAAQQRRESNKLRARRHQKHEYLLASHIHCSCGTAMGGAFKKTNDRRYYMCNAKQAYKHLTTCRELAVDALQSETLVWNWLDAQLRDEEQFNLGLRGMRERHESELRPKLNRLDTLGKEVEKVERRIKRFASAIGDAEDDAILNALRTELRSASKLRDSLISERDTIKSELERDEMTEQTQEAVKRKVDKIRKMLDNASFEDKRFLLDSLDVQVKVDYQNGQRGLWVTCGIKVDADWLPFEYQAS